MVHHYGGLFICYGAVQRGAAFFGAGVDLFAVLVGIAHAVCVLGGAGAAAQPFGQVGATAAASGR